MKIKNYSILVTKMGLLLLATFLLVTFINVNKLLGQEKSDEINPNHVPEVVRNSIQTDFPFWPNIKWYAFDTNANEWAMLSIDRREDGVIPDYYIAKAKSENVETTAVYDKNGTLKSSRTIIKNLEVPANILTAINKEYPGWIVTKNEVVIHNFDENKKYVMVKIQKDHKKKDLYFDKFGNKVKRMKVR